MSYKLNEQRITPGGLNLLVPSDQNPRRAALTDLVNVPQGESLDLTDWWAGSDGRLEQAPIAQEYNNPLVFSAQNSVLQANGQVYYSDGSNLREVGRSSDAAFDTGYDGFPLGMISFQGFAWFMNRSKQRRDDGTTTSDWTPAAPTSAPTLTDLGTSAPTISITAASTASPTVLTSTAHGLSTSDSVTIAGGTGTWTAINGTWDATVIDANNFTIPVSGTGRGSLTGTVVANTPYLLPSGAGPGPNGGTGAKFHLYEDSYRFTWVLAGLGETNPSPATLLTPALDWSSTKIQTAGSPPTGATGWNLYRQIPAYGGVSLDAETAPYLVNSAPIAIGTYFTDTGNVVDGLDDTSLLRVGTILDATHDPAPAARIMANQAYNGRIVVASSAAYPNRMWWTQALQPAFFRGSGDAYDGDWVDVGTDSGDPILAITVKPGMLVIYRAHSIWRHLGDLGDPAAVLEPIVPDLGIVGPRAVASTAAGDYLIAPEGPSAIGVYVFNADWPSKLSLKIDPLFRGLPTENFSLFGSAYRSQCAIGHKNGRLWVSYPNTSGTQAGSMIYHIPSGRWFPAALGYYAFLDTGDKFLGAGAGVFSLESAYVGTSSLAWQSQYHDCGLPDRMKTWGDLVLTHNTQGVTLTIVCRINKDEGSNASFTLTTISSTTETRQVIPLNYPSGYAVTALRGLPIKSFNLSIRITGSGATGSTPVAIETPLLLHYYVEARAGKTFDSGPTNHGLEGVGSIDQVEIDIDASQGAATLVISSDIPGGVLTASGVGPQTIAMTTGRQVVRFCFGTAIDGRLFRHQISSTADFAVYGYKVRILPVGVYADGSQGDFWYTKALAPGE